MKYILYKLVTKWVIICQKSFEKLYYIEKDIHESRFLVLTIEIWNSHLLGNKKHLQLGSKEGLYFYSLDYIRISSWVYRT